MSCLFCDIANKKEKGWIIYEDEYICAFFDYNPASVGHTLIVPKRHYSNIFDIPDDILERIVCFAKKFCIFYKEKFGTNHINLVNSNGEYAGQEIFHYHMHVVPRSKNDNVTFVWIPDEQIRKRFDSLRDEIIKGLNSESSL